MKKVLNGSPVRRHNKTGIVEIKNLNIKRVLNRLQLDSSTADGLKLLTRAKLLSKVFSGSKLLRSFELMNGYTSALLAIPPSVKPMIFYTHKMIKWRHAPFRVSSPLVSLNLSPTFHYTRQHRSLFIPKYQAELRS